jgi:hypothetical protein
MAEITGASGWTLLLADTELDIVYQICTLVTYYQID